VLHVLFRALWIGSLGLRSGSGEIEYDKLNYSKKFTKYLKKKVGSFDDYIRKLEDLSSIMFAISFLLIFYVVAFTIINYINNSLVHFIPNIKVKWIRIGFSILIIAFYIGMILTFIDFLTQGLLKKNKWISMIYFPFYRIFSILTLSFLYRPLVYNFLDNKFGRRISLMLFPIYFIIYLTTLMQYQTSNILPLWSIDNTTQNIALNTNYEDAIKKDKYLHIDRFAIQSKIITEPYIKVVIPLIKDIEDSLIKFNPDLKPKEDIRGYYSEFNLTINNKNINELKKVNIDSVATVFLNTFKECYRFKIDSTLCKTDFIIINDNENNLGVETYIGIKKLQEGKHIIEFQKLLHKNSDSLKSILKVPFWYFKK
jgi:hypothetical protein